MLKENNSVLEYWDKEDVESMYDKYLLDAEIQLIKDQLRPNTKILDVGCGEGEGTLEYAKILNSVIHAVDFSDVRLKKAQERLKEFNNVTFTKVDFLGEYIIDSDYDFIISQRFLINLITWANQSKVLLDLMSRLKSGGKLLLLEGSLKGVEELNNFRSLLGMDPISVKWHNLFFDDELLLAFMDKNGFKLINKNGLGSYFLLTRGIKPFFDKKLEWNSEFNKIASTKNIEEALGIGLKFSRLKLWVFQK